jgi:hypothetical protein
MAYVSPNYKTKRALKEAVQAGKEVAVFDSAGFFPKDFSQGRHTIEGPHYPEPHRWYANVVVENSLVVSVK